MAAESTPPSPSPSPAEPPVVETPAPAEETPAPAPDVVPAPAVRRTSFGSADPDARAQRIARALVSDIVAYHPGRVEEALAAGTLRGEFREEVMKSWDEYVAQVGMDVARTSPYFRDALNQILARGQQVF
jgi:hypothetical protein